MARRTTCTTLVSGRSMFPKNSSFDACDASSIFRKHENHYLVSPQNVTPTMWQFLLPYCVNGERTKKAFLCSLLKYVISQLPTKLYQLESNFEEFMVITKIIPFTTDDTYTVTCM